MPTNFEAEIAELKGRLDTLRPGPRNQLSMIVFSGDLDKLIAAMVIATGAAAGGMRTVLFFTFWGTAALRDPKKRAPGKDLLSTLFGWMLPRGYDGFCLSRMHLGGMGTAMIRSVMRRKKTPSVAQLFAHAALLGVEIKICEMSMELMGLRREEMIDYPHLEICGVATFLAEARESAIQLFV
jgi:peroxiredoxin family protein